jgi:hypothetical protein
MCHGEVLDANSKQQMKWDIASAVMCACMMQTAADIGCCITQLLLRHCRRLHDPPAPGHDSLQQTARGKAASPARHIAAHAVCVSQTNTTCSGRSPWCEGMLWVGVISPCAQRHDMDHSYCEHAAALIAPQ